MLRTTIGPYEQLLEEGSLQTEGGVLDAEMVLGRRKKRLGLLLRALYGEFFATLIFFTCVFGALAKCHAHSFDEFQTGLTVSFTAAFVAISVIFCYSSVSGAHFNSAISFSLWLTGKLSNRKLILYWSVQFMASMVAMLFVYLTFENPKQDIFHAIAVIPAGADKWRIFNTEYISTFFLTYVVYHVAFETEGERRSEVPSVKQSGGLTVYTTAPQSKGAFTPFVFGFLLFGLLQWGGTSGAAMNPLRLLAPAICSGEWASVWIYILGQLAGAATGGIVVHWVEKLHNLGWQSGPVEDLEEGNKARYLQPIVT